MRQRFQQLPIPLREGYDVISGSQCIVDIRQEVVETWGCQRLLLVVSQSLIRHHMPGLIDELRSALPEGSLVSVKIGVGPHSPYADVIDITQRIQSLDIDCVCCIGSGSYSDACKVATVLAESLPCNGDKAGSLTEEAIEALVDSATGLATPERLKPPRAKLVCVPTSLSAGEYNAIGACTTSEGKKQHFWRDEAAPRLILLDPQIAQHTPTHLWLCSGVRAMDHAVEVMCNPKCVPDAAEAQKQALKILLRGLRAYKEIKSINMPSSHDEDQPKHGSLSLDESILICQSGARQAMCAALQWRTGFGLSHAIGHQLGSVAGVDHGVTSCILLPHVLSYTKETTEAVQAEILCIFNEASGWVEKEREASDAVRRFVQELGMPTTLKEVGVTDPNIIQQVASKTLTDAISVERKLPPVEDILKILKRAQ